ncbi:MAG: hypothetical protein BHV93_11645 [Clostridiales bacterium 52_15]|nr:MAG: hypothetical protein BHV93_11645 [Clostridiales bacterium 52_15]
MKKNIVLAVIATAAMALSLVGCGVKVTNISVPDAATLEKGERITLPVNFGTEDAPAETPVIATGESATAETAAQDEKIAKAAEKLTLAWASSDESVATVDETGTVTAVAAGEAEITATVKDTEMQDVCVITVKVSAKELKVPDTLEVKLNDTNEAAIEAKCEPKDASNISFDFASSDEEVATVDKDGKVKVLKAGECDITTTLMQNGERVTEKTTHVKAFYEVESITLDSNEGKLTVGNSHTIKATVAPEEVASETTIEWLSSNEKVATVDSNGKVTAVASGNAVITATSESNEDVKANYDVTVTDKATSSSSSSNKGTTSSKGNTSTGSSSWTGGSTSTGSSSSAGSTTTTPTAPSNPAPAPAAPDPTPVQPSNPEPAQPSNPEPAQPSNPDPAPAPDPEPVQPSQPSGGTTDGSGANGGQVIEGGADKSCPPEEHEVGWC